VKRMICLLAACLIAAATCGCDGSTRPDPSSADDFRLFLCMEGRPRSLLVIDPIGFSVEDTVQLPHTPLDIEFSKDFSRWYVTSGSTIFEIDAASREILTGVDTQGALLATTSDKDMLVSHGKNVMELWSLDAFTLVHSESLKVWQVVPAPDDPEIIYGAYKLVDPQQKGLYGIFEYDTRSRSLERTMQVDPPLQRNMIPHDLEISSDGDFLFLTVYVYGIERAYFYAIDVREGVVLGKHLISGWAQMGLSRDGRYVYITDPGGYMDERVLPQGIVRRYDVSAQSMEEFLNLSPYIDTGSVLPPMSDQIVIMPGNRTVFMSSWSVCCQLMKWDFARQALLGKMGFDVKRGQLIRVLELERIR
jgi:hypothetical protein